ncbi:MAG: Calx-beta domain-containing protein, partial [Candidatus Neomarinimicrobiota bacterium]
MNSHFKYRLIPVLLFVLTGFTPAETIKFLSTSTSGAENTSGTQTVQLVANGYSALDLALGNVSVEVQRSNSSTASTGDVSWSNTTIVFGANNDSIKSITFTVVDDIRDEDNETFILTLANPSQGSLASPTTYTFTINDDDAAPEVTFTQSSSSDQEDTDWSSVAVALSAASGKTITLNFQVTGGTATGSGVDYDAYMSTQLTFSPGSTTQNISTYVNEDALDEDDETIIFALRTPVNVTIGDDSTHTFSIIDNDDSPTVAFTSSSGSGNEGVGTANIQLGLSAVSGRTVSVSYSINGSSTATGGGTDYVLAAGSASFTAGQQYTDISITGINTDALYENNETIIIDISNPVNATLGATTQYTYTINNTTSPPSLQFAAETSSGSEAASPAGIVVSSQLSGLNATVDYAVSGTATGSGTDYTLVNGTLTITAGSTSGNISIPIVNDLLDEADETIILTLSNPTNATLGTQSTHTYTITDNDNAPTVGFSTTSSTVTEDQGAVTLTISLSAISGRTITVDHALTGGTATDGSDYSYTPGTATIVAGASSTTISLTVTNDVLDEVDEETVILALSGATNATLSAADEYTLTISDNDASPSIAFSSTTSTGSEATSPVSLTVQLSAASARNVTVGYAATGGTASGSGTDYTLASGTATITAGATSTLINIIINNDAIFEDDETIEVELSGPTNATVGANFTHTYTIADDDPTPTIYFSSATSSGAENSTPATITINLSDISGLAATVDYALTGTASGGGVDYTLANGTATITAAATSTTVQATIVDDALLENSETIILTLSNPTNSALGGTTVHTYTITDNETAPTIDFSLTSSTADEAAGTKNLTVRLSAVSGLNASTNYSVTGGNASGAGVDYTLASGTATITAGLSTVTVPVTITDDTLDERDETVVVTLAAPTNATLGVNTVHTLTITDNDNPVKVAFANATSTVSEEVSPKSITVQLNAVSGKEVSVDYAVTGGTASPAGVDYTLAAGTATIAAGATSTTIDVTINDDLLDEASETVIIGLSSPDSADLGTISSHTLTITDNDDPPTVQFTATSSSGGEGTASVNLGLQISAVSGRNVTVDYAVSGGTAAGSGTDYTLASGTATITAGTTTTTVTIDIEDDALDEDAETIIVDISSPVAAALGTNTSYTYTITDNDDLPLVNFSTATASGGEATTPVTVTINLSPVSGRTVTVDYDLSGGTATAGGTDFSYTAGTATFAAGEISKTFTFAVTNDLLDEAAETVIFALSDPVNVTVGATSE